MIREIDFDTIVPFWHKLWPGRESPIKAISSMQYGGGYDMEIYQYEPKFWGYFVDETIVGVISGFQTATDKYCLRGIYVEPETRSTGAGRALAQAVENEARRLGCSKLWTMPRTTSLPFYERCGYVQTHPFVSEGFEFGPNCYALKDLR